MPEPGNFDFTPEDHISGEIGERVRGILSAAESAAAVIRQEAEQEISARKRLAEAERARYLETAREEADDLLTRRIARMNELSDALIEGAERLLGRMEGAQDLRRQLDRTVATLAETAARLAEESRLSSAPAPAPEPEVVAETAATEPVEPEPESEMDAEQELDDVEVAEAEAVEAEPGDEDEPERRLRPAPEPVDAETNGAAGAGHGEAEADDVLAARLVALQMAVAGSPRGEVEEHLRSTFAVEDTTSILNDVFGTDAPRLR